MPRIRSIKPEFWSSEQVLECSMNARLLFIGMWNFCDDQGRHKFSAKQLKAEVFPADEVSLDTIRGMIDELSENDLVTPYVVDGTEYLQVNGWHHQRIDKPQAPKHPGMDQADSTNVRGTLPPDRKGEDRKGEDGKGKEVDARQARNDSVSDDHADDTKASDQQSADVQAVFDYWKHVMGKRSTTVLDDKRKRRIKWALNQYGIDGARKAIDGCKASPFHMGENDTGQRHDDLTLIFRNAEKAERFLEFADNPPAPKRKTNGRQRQTGGIAEWLGDEPTTTVIEGERADSGKPQMRLIGGGA